MFYLSLQPDIKKPYAFLAGSFVGDWQQKVMDGCQEKRFHNPELDSNQDYNMLKALSNVMAVYHSDFIVLKKPEMKESLGSIFETAFGHTLGIAYVLVSRQKDIPLISGSAAETFENLDDAIRYLSKIEFPITEKSPIETKINPSPRQIFLAGTETNKRAIKSLDCLLSRYDIVESSSCADKDPKTYARNYEDKINASDIVVCIDSENFSRPNRAYMAWAAGVALALGVPIFYVIADKFPHPDLFGVALKSFVYTRSMVGVLKGKDPLALKSSYRAYSSK